MLVKLLQFFKLLIKTRSYTAARHRTFHSHYEQWSMIQFKDSRDSFYRSKHRVSCDKCGFEKMSQCIWPKFNADLEQGYQLAEAHKKAAVYSPLSEAA